MHFQTACTFLGPSRKRGPPKGYIDAIESRLHQTEALIGIILALAYPEGGPTTSDNAGNVNGSVKTGSGKTSDRLAAKKSTSSKHTADQGDRDAEGEESDDEGEGLHNRRGGRGGHRGAEKKGKSTSFAPSTSKLVSTSTLSSTLATSASTTTPATPSTTVKFDERARSLIEDLRASDPLAREIVDRVDRGAYGTRGRRNLADAVSGGGGIVTGGTASGSGSGEDSTKRPNGKTPSSLPSSASTTHPSSTPSSTPNPSSVPPSNLSLSNLSTLTMGAPPPSIQGRGRMVGLGQEIEMGGLINAHPSNEWQDTVVERVRWSVGRGKDREAKERMKEEGFVPRLVFHASVADPEAAFHQELAGVSLVYIEEDR